MQQSIETETETLLKKIQHNPEVWLDFKRFIFIGLIHTWNQQPNIAEMFAEQFGRSLVKYIKEKKYETADKEEELKNIFKNSLLLHQKNELVLKNIFVTILRYGYNPKNDFQTIKKTIINSNIFRTGSWNNQSEQKFKSTITRNMAQLEKCVLDEINSDKLQDEGLKEFFNGVAFIMFLLALLQAVSYFLKLSFTTRITLAAIGGGVLIGNGFNHIRKIIKSGDNSISENIQLELKKSYQLPSKYRKTRSYHSTSNQTSEQTFIFEIKPVSYLPALPVEESGVESTTHKKPFARKGRHESKPDTRTFEERMDAIGVKSSCTLDPSSTTTSSQEIVPLESEETATFELTPEDFGYPELKQKYLKHVQGAGFFIFNKYAIREQALKEGHEKQYQDLKKTYLDESSQRLARPQGQSGHLKLANEAGYEFKTTHGPQRALFFNQQKNIARAEKAIHEKTHRYKAKVYNEYSPEGLHSGKGL